VDEPHTIVYIVLCYLFIYLSSVSLEKIAFPDTINNTTMALRYFMNKETALKESKTFCMLPWTHLHSWPDGRVLPCCMAPSDQVLGDLKEQSFEQIWNSTKLKKMRTNMREGRACKECSRCYEMEKSGMPTTRTWANNWFSNHFDKVESTKVDGTVDKVNIPYIDFRFSNICNFKCRSCGPELSSSWYDDQKKLYGSSPTERKIIRPYKNEEMFWEKVEPYMDGLEEIYFAGGEPLIMEEHYRILKRLDERKMYHVRLKYNTNFSQMVFKGMDVLDIWSRFEHVKIGASLDGAYERGEYIRKGQDWNQVLENGRNMRNRCQNAFLFLSSCLSVYNSFHMSDFHIDWIKKGWIDPVGGSLINPLMTPEELSIQILPKYMKERLTQKWEEADTFMRSQGNTEGRYKMLTDHLWAKDSTHLIPEFIKRTEKVDKIRNENWLTVFPELSDLAKYVGSQPVNQP
tara:strand:+ start:3077 stop:4453 length:1377 start_codon:yes stop_codon:yes gene_type:complete